MSSGIRMELVSVKGDAPQSAEGIAFRRLRQVALHQRAINQLGFCSAAWPVTANPRHGRGLALAVIRKLVARFGLADEVMIHDHRH